MEDIITKEFMKDETPKTPRNPYLNPRFSGVEMNELKNLLTGEKYLIII